MWTRGLILRSARRTRHRLGATASCPNATCTAATSSRITRPSVSGHSEIRAVKGRTIVSPERDCVGPLKAHRFILSLRDSKRGLAAGALHAFPSNLLPISCRHARYSRLLSFLAQRDAEVSSHRDAAAAHNWRSWHIADVGCRPAAARATMAATASGAAPLAAGSRRHIPGQWRDAREQC